MNIDNARESAAKLFRIRLLVADNCYEAHAWSDHQRCRLLNLDEQRLLVLHDTPLSGADKDATIDRVELFPICKKWSVEKIQI
jgi:hypothetical protein